MAFNIIRGDIVTMKVDAIVNAANSSLQPGGWVSGAIFREAGSAQLARECERIGGCEPGKAVITRAYNLPSKHIIHTVGPVWRGGVAGEALILRSCYRSALELAKKHRLNSIAFPLLATGVFGYPKDKALDIAVDELGKFALEDDMDIYLVIYNSDDYYISDSLWKELKAYINEHKEYESGERIQIHFDFIPAGAEEKDIGRMEESLFRKANFTKLEYLRLRLPIIRKELDKEDVLRIAIGLELGFKDMRMLLEQYNFSFEASQTRDLIIRYFVEKNQFNIFEINKALFAFGCQTL